MARENRFVELLSSVAREVTLRQASDICCGDLTLEQFQTLQAVSASEKPSVGALSLALHVDLSTMSRNVTLIERNGYVVRARSDEDGRVVHIMLTGKGKRALETLRCDEREVLKDVYQRLQATERPAVIKALEVLQACLERASGDTGACCPPVHTRKATS